MKVKILWIVFLMIGLNFEGRSQDQDQDQDQNQNQVIKVSDSKFPIASISLMVGLMGYTANLRGRSVASEDLFNFKDRTSDGAERKYRNFSQFIYYKNPPLIVTLIWASVLTFPILFNDSP